MTVDGIILAAGLSSRMGKCKMLLEVGGKTIIESCVNSMYDYCSHIIVVSGYNHTIIKELLKPYKKVTVVFNKNYLEGMFSSVKIGIKKIRGDRFFLIPGDYPLIRKDTYKELIRCKAGIVIATYNGKQGHPILVDSRLIYDVLENTSYESMRDFIKMHDSTCIEVMDEGILMDVDTPYDYEKVMSVYKKYIKTKTSI